MPKPKAPRIKIVVNVLINGKPFRPKNPIIKRKIKRRII